MRPTTIAAATALLCAALPSTASAQAWAPEEAGAELEPTGGEASAEPDEEVEPETARQIREVRELFEQEPTWTETYRKAMRWLRVHPEAIEGVRERLRSKAGAPLVLYSGWYEHGIGRRDMTIDPGPTRRLHDETDMDHPRTTLVASFNLPDSVFTPAELQTYSLTLVQQDILRMVNIWYYYRRHFAIRLYIDPPVDPRARTTLELRIRGFTALLDVATGGWFSRQLPEGAL